MKVLCIKKDTPGENHIDLINACKKIEVGSFYTVVDDHCLGYELEEFPHERKMYWNKECFAHVSDIDETEFTSKGSSDYASITPQDKIYH